MKDQSMWKVRPVKANDKQTQIGWQIGRSTGCGGWRKRDGVFKMRDHELAIKEARRLNLEADANRDRGLAALQHGSR